MVKVPAIFNPDAHLYFEWTPYDFSTFIIYILFGLITLWGGVWWIKVHYMPAAKAAGVPVHPATVWIVLLLTIFFYVLTASSAASVHLWTLPRSEPWAPFIPRLWQTQLASMAFQNISAAGWMFTLLVHARIVRRKLAPVQSQARPSTTMFFPVLVLLGCSVVLGGFILSAYLGHSYAVGMGIFKIVTAALVLLASCALFYSVIIIRKTTHMYGQSDPLRKVIFIAIPLWVIYGIQFMVFVSLKFAFQEVSILFYLSLVFFGFGSLATILVLPGMLVGTEYEKLDACSMD